MEFNVHTFLTAIKALVVGGGREADGVTPQNDAGYLHDINFPLNALVNLTDSSGGTASDTIAAGAGVQTIEFSHTFIGGTSAVEPVTNYTPGFAFKIIKWAAVSDVLLVGAGGSRVANMEIGTTDVGTVPSTITIIEANATVGTVTAGTTVTGANTGLATDTISIEIANGGTAFTAGKVNFLITLQNMDTANAISSLASGGLTASETNLKVKSFAASTTTAGTLTFVVPRDYDEATNTLAFQMSAAMAGSTDTPGITATAYRKRPGSNIATVAATVAGKLRGVSTAAALSSASQVIVFDFSNNSLLMDDAITVVFTVAAHTTDALLVYAIEPLYRSTLVSYKESIGGTRDGKDGTFLR